MRQTRAEVVTVRRRSSEKGTSTLRNHTTDNTSSDLLVSCSSSGCTILPPTEYRVHIVTGSRQVTTSDRLLRPPFAVNRPVTCPSGSGGRSSNTTGRMRGWGRSEVVYVSNPVPNPVRQHVDSSIRPLPLLVPLPLLLPPPLLELFIGLAAFI